MTLESDCELCTYVLVILKFICICDCEFICICDVVDISIWTACDAYCELSMMDVMFIWMWYVAMTEPNKLVICGSFAECYTRQKVICWVPWKIHSANRTCGKNLCILGAKMASLSSVSTWTLGKETKSWVWNGHSLPSVRDVTLGKHGLFAECLGRDTRQTCIICRVS